MSQLRDTLPTDGEFSAGRALTLERVRQLNSKDYFYQMLKDTPAMTKIYPGIENELLKGAIDGHIHAYPDFVHRSQDMIQIALDASKAGMRAIAFKDHWNVTGPAAYLTQRHIDHLVEKGELANRILVYGGIGTCFGMNPEYVRIGLQYPNTKMIWFPTFTSLGYRRGAGHIDQGGVRLVSEQGEVLPEVVAIMKMAVEKRVGIGFGHTDFTELLPLAKKAQELGVRAVLDHPLLELNRLLVDEMKELATLGVLVGTYCQPMIPSLYQPVLDPVATVTTIKAVGAEHCLIGSDFGQVLHMDSIDGVRVFLRTLLAYGITAEEIRTMIQDNPAKLMWMDEGDGQDWAKQYAAIGKAAQAT
ncbi:MAG: amidohydrolase [Chloroflexi bacterium]|nr:amidohydrolase [Chloroflexota bacterium]